MKFDFQDKHIRYTKSEQTLNRVKEIVEEHEDMPNEVKEIDEVIQVHNNDKIQ